MAHDIHEGHTHQHGPGCGHTAIAHNGHTDYLNEGCMHHQRDGRVEEHSIEVSATNPDQCTHGVKDAHESTSHRHGEGCGHEAVPHGDHVDYLVAGKLHHPHGDHCDDHGSVTLR
jgi:hypothetical protein